MSAIIKDCSSFSQRRRKVFYLFILLFTFSLVLGIRTVQTAEQSFSEIGWAGLSTLINAERISNFTISSKSGKIYVGTFSGEIYLSTDLGKTWKQVKKTSVPLLFMKKILVHGKLFLQNFSQIKDRDIDKLLEVMNKEKTPEIDIRDIDYSDLSFEDIDLNAVDPSDIEFRDNRDPDEVDLNDVDEEDIETIDISDESYLNNPDDVKERLAEDKKQPSKIFKPDVSKRAVKKLLLRYSDVFLSIKSIDIAKVSGEEDIALSPIALFQENSVLLRWQPILEADWSRGEHFLSFARSTRHPEFYLLLSSKGLYYSFDRGKNWDFMPLVLAGQPASRLSLFGKDMKHYILFASDDIVLGKIVFSEHRVSYPQKSIVRKLDAGLLKGFSIDKETILLISSKGIFLSGNLGSGWLQLAQDGFLKKQIGSVYLFPENPQRFIFNLSGTIFFTKDGGKSFFTIPAVDISSSIEKIFLERRNERDYYLWALNKQGLYSLSLIKDGKLNKLIFKKAPKKRKKISAPMKYPKGLSFLTGQYQASKFGLWNISEYSHWRTSTYYAGLFPKLIINFSYYDMDQNKLRFDANSSTLHTNPDYYTVSPIELTNDSYLNQYYIASFALKWDFRKLVHSIEQLTMKKMLTRSYKRKTKLKKRFRNLFMNRINIEKDIQVRKNYNVGHQLDLLLRQQELDALISVYSGNSKSKGFY